MPVNPLAGQATVSSALSTRQFNGASSPPRCPGLSRLAWRTAYFTAPSMTDLGQS